MTQEQAEEKTVHPHGFISKELKQAVYALMDAMKNEQDRIAEMQALLTDCISKETLDQLIVIYCVEQNISRIRPKGATNGDMFQAMFPDAEVKAYFLDGFDSGVDVFVSIDKYSNFKL